MKSFVVGFGAVIFVAALFAFAVMALAGYLHHGR